MLKDVTTIVFDIQDIGTRFYTYITTMGQALEEAAKHKIRFVVLDRPNPIGGEIIEGDILDSDVRRMTGYFEIPTRHGFTVGELA
jgi:beta-N-acetylhexosaminidase